MKPYKHIIKTKMLNIKPEASKTSKIRKHQIVILNKNPKRYILLGVINFRTKVKV